MNLARIKRIPARIRRDLQFIRMLKNYEAALAEQWTGKRAHELRLRNGVVLTSPDSQSLTDLFHEIWIREDYCPAGYKIRPDDVVIDIGANIGVFAAYAASRARDGRVYAYEPFPGCVTWLRKNIEASRLDNVVIIPQGVAGKQHARKLRVSSLWILNSLYESIDEGSELQIDCVGLEQVFGDNKLDHCDLLKIDCEGAEYEILEECPPDILDRVRRITGEYHQGAHQRGTGEGLRRFLESRSFRMDKLHPLAPDTGIFCATNTNY